MNNIVLVTRMKVTIRYQSSRQQKIISYFGYRIWKLFVLNTPQKTIPDILNIRRCGTTSCLWQRILFLSYAYPSVHQDFLFHKQKQCVIFPQPPLSLLPYTMVHILEFYLCWRIALFKNSCLFSSLCRGFWFPFKSLLKERN